MAARPWRFGSGSHASCEVRRLTDENRKLLRWLETFHARQYSRRSRSGRRVGDLFLPMFAIHGVRFDDAGPYGVAAFVKPRGKARPERQHVCPAVVPDKRLQRHRDGGGTALGKTRADYM
jgi:hypothetical protein